MLKLVASSQGRTFFRPAAASQGRTNIAANICGPKFRDPVFGKEGGRAKSEIKNTQQRA